MKQVIRPIKYVEFLPTPRGHDRHRLVVAEWEGLRVKSEGGGCKAHETIGWCAADEQLWRTQEGQGQILALETSLHISHLFPFRSEAETNNAICCCRAKKWKGFKGGGEV
jgi:hypothetical protein